MTLANVALLLAMAGYEVLCIDLDLEAPGLAEAFKEGLNTSSAERDGFVEYAERTLEGSARNLAGDELAKALPIIELEPGGGRPPFEGTLWLLRAGNYTELTGQRYWNLMIAGFLENFYPFQEAIDDLTTPGALVENAEAVAGEEAGEDTRKGDDTHLWGGVRTRISNLDPAPDFVLVDTRTGFSPLSMSSIDAFLSRVVLPNTESIDLCVFVDRGSDASRLGTRAFLREIDAQSRRSYEAPLTRRPSRVHVVCRDQQLLDNQALSAKVGAEHWLTHDSDERWQDRVDCYRVIRSDPVVERTGKAVVATLANEVHVGLRDDYVSIAALLCGEPDVVGDDPRAEEDLRSLRHRLALPDAAPAGFEQPDFKLFSLPKDGQMRNVDDDALNISFSKGTFTTLVQQLAAAHDPGALDAAGRSAGVAFGRSLHALATVSKLTPEELLARWRRLDSMVGWGSFELRLASVDRAVSADDFVRGGAAAARAVRVHKNAFAIPLEPGRSDLSLCGFLGGYVCGLVGVLLGEPGEPLTLSAGEHITCMALNADLDYCEFVLESRTVRERA